MADLRRNVDARGIQDAISRRTGGFKEVIGPGPKTPIPYAGFQKASLWGVNSRTAGATGGAPEGSPRHSRIFCVASILHSGIRLS